MLRRAASATTIVAALAMTSCSLAMTSCSLFVSLDGLSSDDPDAAIADAGPIDSAPIVDGSTDVSVEANAPYLSVDPCVPDSNDVANLSALGTLDWSHFAGASSDSDVKNIANHILGPLAQSGAGNQEYTDDPRTFAWTDGTTTSTEPGMHSGVYDERGPMVLTATSSSSRRALTVYIGTFTANAQLDVALSAGLAAPPQMFTGVSDMAFVYRCAIHYSAPSDGTLTVTWSLPSGIDAGTDVPNIAFPAATVASE